MTKIPIKIILPGGGVKCAYQVGFLDELLNSDDFFNKYDVIEINGSSGGAIVGSYAATGQIKYIEEIISKHNSIDDVFIPWFDIPYINKLHILHFIIKIINLFISVTKRSLFNPKKLYDSIDGLDIDVLKEQTYNKIIGLNKFNCVVTNLSDQKIEYINGSNIYIKDYIKASSTLWLLCPPYVLNSKEYMDGGLCELYPFGHDATLPNVMYDDDDIIKLIDIDKTHTDSDCKYILVNTQNGKPLKHDSRDIFYYLNSIIHTTHQQLAYHRIIHHDILKNKNILNYMLPNNIFTGSVDINRDKISAAINAGKKDGLKCLNDLNCLVK